jgi:hypothetical protein
MTVKNAIMWDVAPCGSCKNRCFRGMYRLSTVMMGAILSYEMLAHILEDGIFHGIILFYNSQDNSLKLNEGE